MQKFLLIIMLLCCVPFTFGQSQENQPKEVQKKDYWDLGSKLNYKITHTKWKISKISLEKRNKTENIRVDLVGIEGYMDALSIGYDISSKEALLKNNKVTKFDELVGKEFNATQFTLYGICVELSHVIATNKPYVAPSVSKCCEALLVAADGNFDPIYEVYEENPPGFGLLSAHIFQNWDIFIKKFEEKMKNNEDLKIVEEVSKKEKTILIEKQGVWTLRFNHSPKQRININPHWKDSLKSKSKKK